MNLVKRTTFLATDWLEGKKGLLFGAVLKSGWSSRRGMWWAELQVMWWGAHDGFSVPKLLHSWQLRWPLQAEPEFLGQFSVLHFFLWCLMVFGFFFSSCFTCWHYTQFHNCGQFQLNFLHVMSGDWWQIFSGVQNPCNNCPLKEKFGVLTASLLFKLMATQLNSIFHRFSPDLQPRHQHFATDKDNFGIIHLWKGLNWGVIWLGVQGSPFQMDTGLLSVERYYCWRDQVCSTMSNTGYGRADVEILLTSNNPNR